MAAKGPKGESLSLLTGDETLEELEKLVLFLSLKCPADKSHPHCPFRALSGLSYSSLKHLIRDISMSSCQDLFELELHCRTKANTSCELAENLAKNKSPKPIVS